MPKPPSAADTGIDRRTLLHRAWQALAGFVLVGSWGCAEKPPQPDHTVRVPSSALEPDGRHLVRRPDMRIELRRTTEGFAARSLLCTHFGCFVEWSADQQRYLCPCHDGVFDADGEVLYGPPTRPLAELPVRRQGNELIVDVSSLAPSGEENSR